MVLILNFSINYEDYSCNKLLNSDWKASQEKISTLQVSVARNICMKNE